MFNRMKYVVALATLLSAAAAQAVVNPSLQPSHLMDRHSAVVVLRVKEIAQDDSSLTLEVTSVIKGVFAPKTVTLDVAKGPSGDAEPKDDDTDVTAKPKTPAELVDTVAVGQDMVAYVGKARAGHEGDLLFYLGAGQWQQGLVPDAAQPSKWRWTASLGMTMYGTFTGGADRLAELMADTAAGRAYFPALPNVQFKSDIAVAKLDKPVRGVALHDIDGDGRLDIYACSAAGDRLSLQEDGMKFDDVTAAMGVGKLRSVSCSFADANGDGKTDLLADGVLCLRGTSGFAASALLPAQAAKDVLSSAFVEINGDGYPDVVVSRIKGGLSVYLNPGAAGGAFRDATAVCGLDAGPCGAGRTGYFAAGDWNEDGRTDLFYFAGPGLLLIQDANGRFSPAKLPASFDLAPPGDIAAAGAGVFAPVWRTGRGGAAFPQVSDIRLLADVDGAVADVTELGNEISEATYKQLLTIAEDFNADGYVDLLTTSWSPVTPATLHLNRGYGSYMRPEKYKATVFRGGAHAGGALGAAAGDADGDGANDLLLGCMDGTVALVLNDSLSLRQATENPTAEEKQLREMAIVTVRVTGPLGVTGARVTLRKARPNPIGGAAGATSAPGVTDQRVLGGNIVTGCCGPNTVNLVAREPGPYVLEVRYSDGAELRKTIELVAGKRLMVEAPYGQADRAAAKP